ncbi:MAG: PEGA domain-containing protein [Verrucomicrobiae bacterium]|nr:PEGA domain-containing protein [Verrucomicrobiae bacterium]
MKRALITSLILGGLLALAGCATSKSTAQKPERGPDGTIAYLVEVESSEPGARIEVNNEYVGKAPCTIKIFGDKDGTFHNFGSYHFRITAYPVRAGQQPQTKEFRTGGWFTEEDRIPRKIFFDFGPVPEAQKPETK